MNNSMLRDLPPYEYPPRWIPPDMRRGHPGYDNDVRLFLPRRLVLQRDDINSSLGFFVSGGDAMPGMFISRVLPNTEAAELGLREGDQLLEVNGMSFQNIDHSEAVDILKGNLRIEMIVKFFPYAYEKMRVASESNVG